jgi:hypothetical protein
MPIRIQCESLRSLQFRTGELQFRYTGLWTVMNSTPWIRDSSTAPFIFIKSGDATLWHATRSDIKIREQLGRNCKVTRSAEKWVFHFHWHSLFSWLISFSICTTGQHQKYKKLHLTNSMEQSPSWEANSQGSLPHSQQPPVPILSQIDPLHAPIPLLEDPS